MKTKIKVVMISGILHLSGCASTLKNTENISTFSYNTKCIDKKNKMVHFFETNSYIPLTFTQVLKQVNKSGNDISINVKQMDCFQITPEQVTLGIIGK